MNTHGDTILTTTTPALVYLHLNNIDVTVYEADSKEKIKSNIMENQCNVCGFSH